MVEYASAGMMCDGSQQEKESLYLSLLSEDCHLCVHVSCIARVLWRVSTVPLPAHVAHPARVGEGEAS
eukprot:139797-Rhodomonas_salina.1